MRQHGRWGLISTNRVSGINCFIGVIVGTRTGAKCLCPLVRQVVTMISFYNNNTVSGYNNDFDNIVAPW